MRTAGVHLLFLPNKTTLEECLSCQESVLFVSVLKNSGLINRVADDKDGKVGNSHRGGHDQSTLEVQGLLAICMCAGKNTTVSSVERPLCPTHALG